MSPSTSSLRISMKMKKTSPKFYLFSNKKESTQKSLMNSLREMILNTMFLSSSPTWWSSATSKILNSTIWSSKHAWLTFTLPIQSSSIFSLCQKIHRDSISPVYENSLMKTSSLKWLFIVEGIWVATNSREAWLGSKMASYQSIWYGRKAMSGTKMKKKLLITGLQTIPIQLP